MNEPCYQPVQDRRRYVGAVVDAILGYWLNGTENEEMREWWTTQEAADCALELAHVMCQSFEELGFKIAERAEDIPEPKGAE